MKNAFEIQYTLKHLMIAVSILALTLGTYAIGFKRGYRSGHVDGYRADRSAEFGTDSVRIEHLRTQDGFLDSDVMINEIRRNVLPTSWAGSGGNARILTKTFDDGLHLHIKHTEDGIEQIMQYLRTKYQLPPTSRGR